ncbi:glycosyltransferase family 2 protein [Prosthecomicrobium sp. N25]|uniref:glycosyltransferase family 2 protein n=1 Tax=Prosthecomicrobium sp. N25 TaxID=3129254 RepID=UPI00307696CE
MTTQPPKVTVVVPSYNHGAYIGQRLESILNQTYRDFELVVIDDRSPDHSDDVIRSYLDSHQFRYIRNEKNSGTPFAAWEYAARTARGTYLWICESDDVADPQFLSVAVPAMDANPDAALFYTDSWIIDAKGERIDSTDSYFHDIWQESRWDADFKADGLQELKHFQLRGQTVPNMSSALIRTDAFRAAYTPILKRFRLCGDWVFIGLVMLQGAVLFRNEALSHFRRHESTARVRVKSALSQAEFVLTKYLLYRAGGYPPRDFAHAVRLDGIRFIYEPASAWDVVKAMLSVSPVKTIGAGLMLAYSLAHHRDYVARYRARRRQQALAARGS